MGTNYYLNLGNARERFGVWTDVLDFDIKLHIGKSSAGWCFALHVYPDSNLPKDWDAWRALLKEEAHDARPKCLRWIPWMHGPRSKIVSDRGDELSVVEFERVVTSRRWVPTTYPSGRYSSREEFLRINHAVEGPNGLARHRVDLEHCIGHGTGTWDLLVGEFC